MKKGNSKNNKTFYLGDIKVVFLSGEAADREEARREAKRQKLLESYERVIMLTNRLDEIYKMSV